MVVRVFVAGGTGVVGRRLVPQLVARGHQVTATTTSAARLDLLRQLGADGAVMDGLDAALVGEAVATARPDAIVHQMTGLSEAHAGKPNLRKPGRFFAATNRLRSEGTDHLLAAAEATGVTNVVAQGVAIFNGTHDGGWAKTEKDPLEAVPGTAEGMKAISHLEDASGSSRPGVRHAAAAPAAVGAANTATTTTRMSMGFPVRAAAYQMRPPATPAPKAKVAGAILDPRAVTTKTPAT